MQRRKELYPVNRLEEIRILELPFSYSALKDWYDSLRIIDATTSGLKSVVGPADTELYQVWMSRRSGYLARINSMSLHFSPAEGPVSKITVRAREWYDNRFDSTPGEDLGLLSEPNLAWKQGVGSSIGLLPVGFGYRDYVIATAEFYSEKSVDAAEATLIDIGNAVLNDTAAQTA